MYRNKKNLFNLKSFGKKPIQSTRQNIPGSIQPNSDPNNPDLIRLRTINEKYNKTRKRLLIWIGSLALLIIGLVAFAAWRVGGVQNLFQGNGNIISNTVNNVGTAIISSPTASPSPTPTQFRVNIAPITTQPNFLNQPQNSLILTKFRNYNVTVKKDVMVLFVNDTGKIVGLQFSDGRQYRFEVGSQQNILFSKTGRITFTDVIDSRLNPIEGTITVVE